MQTLEEEVKSGAAERQKVSDVRSGKNANKI